MVEGWCKVTREVTSLPTSYRIYSDISNLLVFRASHIIDSLDSLFNFRGCIAVVFFY